MLFTTVQLKNTKHYYITFDAAKSQRTLSVAISDSEVEFVVFTMKTCWSVLACTGYALSASVNLSRIRPQ